MKRSFIWAILFAAIAIGWLASGHLRAAREDTSSQQTADKNTANAEKPFRVIINKFAPSMRQEIITLPGRSEADTTVEARSRTSGIVEKSLIKQGQKVNKGDLLCVLDMMSRNAKLQEAQAEVASAKRDFDAAKSLNKRKITTAAKLASEQARLDATIAKLEQAQLDIEWTRITAPTDGIVVERPAQQGSLLQLGQTCAKIAVMDPVLITGQIAERNVGAIKLGQKATAELISGEKVEGKLRFISPIADIATRTFRIEIEVANPNNTIRDGLTADVQLPLEPVKAHLLPAGIISLNDDGELGVKALDDDNKVVFFPIKPIAETRKGTWVSGLSGELRVIVTGQDYVFPGQVVEPVMAGTEGDQS